MSSIRGKRNKMIHNQKGSASLGEDNFSNKLPDFNGLPPWEVVGVLTTGLSLSSFALSGLYCTHQDISPEYASVLLGITNTVGAMPGIIGVALTGYLLESTHSWSLSLFAPSIFFYLSGTVVWLLYASSKPQNFNND